MSLVKVAINKKEKRKSFRKGLLVGVLGTGAGLSAANLIALKKIIKYNKCKKRRSDNISYS